MDKTRSLSLFKGNIDTINYLDSLKVSPHRVTKFNENSLFLSISTKDLNKLKLVISLGVRSEHSFENNTIINCHSLILK